MDNIVKVGSREKIKEYIASGLSVSLSDAEKVFNYLEAAFRENTTEFGRIDQSTASGKELVFGGGQYYINLPKSVLTVIALVLDISLTKGIISGICGMLGIQTQSFYHMNQHIGEACLLRECLHNNNMAAPEGYRYLIGNECINNDLKCQYRNEDGQCCIQEKDIEAVLIHFREARIVKR